ncbi:DL-methionine transporter subunit; ATP-binding component of ABC superfamily [Luteimonas sp. 9C]|uniref:methionine ABC transporter ATP-binding protein n=1 Tax=Luteimonas sp. 9C TaxID=2653148 RepID=UPI0012F27C05|nr:methionine ABC transporter ATP-binding protein [Luteimonas sp. 9C]VXC18599.1 DL-methionine transporter subunit; ATP-binding component of ABC superfamily [Luteimonas sp. 9C]
MIHFEGIHKSYSAAGRETVALHLLDLTIEAGEVFGIVGHSGAGKSTLLRLINGLETPSGGRLTVDGQRLDTLDGAGLRTLRRRVGMIFQHFNLLSAKTVLDNIAFPLRLAGVSKSQAHARAQELLVRVGLEAHRDKYPAQLSGGQKQRVGVARALATEPKILLCDEATSALDPQTTASVLQLLDGINRELGLTIVLITHEMDVVRRVCDRVAVLDAGHLVESGPVTDVFLHPQHPTTRRFVAESEDDDGAQHDDIAHVEGRLLRLTFTGDATWQPLLGRVARETGIDYTILSGRIDRIKRLPYGQLTLAVTGDRVDEAARSFAAAGVHVQALPR